MVTWKVSSRLLLILAAVAGVLLLWWIIATWWASIWAWWPWTDKKRAERAENRADVAEAVVEGQADIAASVEHHTIIIREADRIAADAEIEARTAPDAETPLDPDRADRLRRADERLCELVPDSCAPASADHP